MLGSRPREGVDLAEQILQVGEHHLLLVPAPQPTLARALICVTTGEPAKADVLFAGRLLRHLGVETTLLSVIAPERDSPRERERAERFLEAGVRTMSLLGVAAETVVRSGAVRDEIIAEMRAGGYDLLVLGAPLTWRDGRGALAGVVGQILSGATDRPVLIVRSPYAASGPWIGLHRRISDVEEIVR